MKEVLKVKLKYTGSDVDDGTMSIEDILPVLQGFAGAYGTVVNTKGLTSEHKLKIVGVEKGSFDILLEVWQWIGNNSAQLQTISTVVGGATFGIASIIIGVIQLKKHVAGQPYTEKIQGVGNTMISVKNSKNVSIEVPVEVFSIFKEGILDGELAKITKPLEKGRIDSAEIRVEHKKEKIKETITVEEKPYFDISTISVTETKEVWLNGAFNSLTKSTNKGFFLLNDGTRASYRFAMKEPEKFYHFFIYNGPVKVRCIAHLDESLKINSLDIYEVQKLQIELFGTGDKK